MSKIIYNQDFFYPDEPIELTGNDDEWEVMIPGLLRNKKCSFVYKYTETGNAFNAYGLAYPMPDQEDVWYFEGEQSWVYINFPTSIDKPIFFGKLEEEFSQG